jgi:opacity protein-like surface antigen
MLIDHEETAQFPTFMLGLHAKPLTGLDIGFRYEHIAKLEWQVQKSNLHLTRAMNPVTAAGYERLLRGTLRAENEVFNHDLPGVAALGIGYTFNPYFRIDISETIYLQQFADWEGLEEDITNGYETAIGIEVSPKPGVLSLSAGVMQSLAGADSDTYFIENPGLDGYTYSGGARWQVSPKIALDAGIAYSIANDDVANHPSLGTIDLKKNVLVYGLSVGLHLP